MAVKKTELYSSLWASCDALRGGMDASQYKDYILTLLFMKYVTDKYKGQKYGDLTVFDKANDPNPDPEKRTGCSFDDFIALKNKKNIGEGIDKIIARLAEVNESLKGVIDIAHFNDEAKIGKDKEMVDKLTKLIAIFQRPELDFSKNKAEGDDIIGDAYEYLMRNFASESGKSKGQFYTPAEVSRILAKVIDIDKCTDHDATVCDPACGSGSLLIRALAEAPFEISGYGQEKDGSTAGLAKMNAVLHNKATIKIMAGNTFSDPQFKKADDASELERFDYIVANPPFSLKNWSDGLKEFGRFSGYGDRPPEKNGDYAWLMHILKTLKSTGKAAVILPHGVLFRGNAEATIRQTIVDKGWIKGIISLPPNLFYGTGIPACIIVIDKEGAENRAGIFMIDAGKGYVKDGSKNRLREQDIYRIVTTFNEQITTDPKYARFVPNKEIKEKNGYNLNISRYIDSSDPEDIQDIYAHIHGGIPAADIDALERFWTAFPTLKNELFGVFSEGYYKLNVEEDVIRQTTYSNTEFAVYGEMSDEAFASWKSYTDSKLKNLKAGVSAKELIIELAQAILKEFESLSLFNKYDVYQVLLAYWNEVLSDDVSMIISDEAGYGVARETENIMKETKKKDDDGNPELKVAGWEGKLIPKALIISELFPEEKKAMDDLVGFVVETNSRLMFLVEESAEDSVLSDVAEGGKVKSKDIQEKMDEIMSHVHTPLIDGLVKLQGMLPMKKKEYVDYISNNIILEVAYTEKGTVTKTSVAYALAMARAEAPAPEAYADDYAELKDLRTDTVSADDETETFEKYEIYLRMLGFDPDNLPEKVSIQKKVEAFEKEVKEKFVNEPANMKLLIVVDKLLTGFDAPPCTYLYIDKSMQDHGLFQAICRVNRLDGDTKEFGYIVDYKQLFGDLKNAMDKYTSGAFENYDPEDVDGLIKDRAGEAIKHFREIYEELEELCEGVEAPKEDLQYLHYFCGVSGMSEDMDEIYARLREKLYKLVSSLVRAFAEAKQYMVDEYTVAEMNDYENKVHFYIELKQTIGNKSGDFLDFKAYEPDMRKLIDNYIMASDSIKIGEFDDLTLLDFVTDQGETMTGEDIPSGQKEGAAEAIENNIRRKMVEKVTVNPKYYEKMSAILDKLVLEYK